jgi:hypothetical protein
MSLPIPAVENRDVVEGVAAISAAECTLVADLLPVAEMDGHSFLKLKIPGI